MGAQIDQITIEAALGHKMGIIEVASMSLEMPICRRCE